MKKFSNLFIVFVLIIAIGVFVEAELLYCEWIFPELSSSVRGGVILFVLVIILLVLYLQLSHLFNPKEKLDKDQEAAKAKNKQLMAVEELRIELLKAVATLIILGISLPLILLAVVWVL